MNQRIKFRHLQAFVAIVHQQSLKRAAEQLLLTQPAISRTLAELEDILGARLLLRDRSGVELTAEGAFFLSFAEASLGALQRGISGIGGFARDSGVSLQIGMQPSAAARLMPAVATLLAERAPEARVTLVEGAHADLRTRLREGQLDLMIGRQAEPDGMGELSFTQLYTERVIFVARPGHPLLARPDLQRIVDWPVIYPPPEDPIRPATRRLLVEAGIPLPAQRIETASGSFGLARCMEGDAIWVVPEGLVAAALEAGWLARLPFETAATAGPVGMMTRAGEQQGPGERLLLPLIREALLWLGPAS